jgi:quinohemoprotein ethanol dehydrogenase
MHVGWKYGAQPRLLLIFKLDCKVARPPSAPPEMTVQTVDDPSLQIKEGDVPAARVMFAACMGYHGRKRQFMHTFI